MQSFFPNFLCIRGLNAGCNKALGKKYVKQDSNNIKEQYGPDSLQAKGSEFNSTTPGKRFVVPNLVHVTWFYSKETLTFRFHMFISLLSAYKFIQPSSIMFWYETEPTGYWWSELRKRVPIIKMCQMKPPTSIFGNPVAVPEHKSDIVRLEVLMKYGGIYMDLDMVILRSFDPLRVYDITMGLALPMETLANGLIVSKPNATFLQLWYNNYKTFDDSNWNKDSVVFALKLAKLHPDLIRVEERRIQRPNFLEKKWIYGRKIYNLSDNYSIHLAYRAHKLEYNQDDIKYMNSTAGNVFRYIYYGSMDLFTPKLIVPQIVHLVWAGTDKFSFHHYMRLVALKKRANMDRIFLWSHAQPDGHWWRRSADMVRFRELSELSSNYHSVEILYRYGGLFMSWNIVPVNPFISLFYYSATLTLKSKNENELNSNVMAATPGSEFFKILLKELGHMNASKTINIDGQLLTRLYKDLYPHLIHIEHRILFTSGLQLGKVMAKGRKPFNWKIAIYLPTHNDEGCSNESLWHANNTMCALYRYLESGDMNIK